MDRRWIAVLARARAAGRGWNLAVYTVPQWKQAIVVQLGEPVRTVREPGLYFKLPLIQNVMYFDNRLLAYDASPKEILTKDKQQLVVDNFSRWRIGDPLQFYRTVRDEAGAQSRLDDVIYSDVRENLGRHTLREIMNEKRTEVMAEVTGERREGARLRHRGRRRPHQARRPAREERAERLRPHAHRARAAGQEVPRRGRRGGAQDPLRVRQGGADPPRRGAQAEPRSPAARATRRR